METRDAEVALAFIEAMGRGDAAAAADCLAPDAITVAHGTGKLAGTRRRDVILATIAAFRELFPGGMRPEIRSVTAGGGRVAVEFKGNAELADGTPYHNEYCMVFSLEGGRIARIDEYFCTLLADRVLGERVAPGER